MNPYTTCNECDEPIHARGLCHKHYSRLTRRADWNPVKYEQKSCSAEGCERAAKNCGMCFMHYMRDYRSKNPKKASRTKPKVKMSKVNEVKVCTIPECVNSGYYGDGKCKKHWMKEYRVRRKVELAGRVTEPDSPEAFWKFVQSELGLE